MRSNRFFRRHRRRLGLRRLQDAVEEPLEEIANQAGAIAREARRRMVRGRHALGLKGGRGGAADRDQLALVALAVAAGLVGVALWLRASSR